MATHGSPERQPSPQKKQILQVGLDLVQAVLFCVDVAGTADAARAEVLQYQLKRARRVAECLERLAGHIVRGRWQSFYRSAVTRRMKFHQLYLLHAQDGWNRI